MLKYFVFHFLFIKGDHLAFLLLSLITNSINVLVYWPSLRNAGIEPDEPLTLKLDDVTAETALTSILRYLSSGTMSKLDYQVDRGVVEIGMADELVRRKVLKVYYVGDLLQPRSTVDSDFYDSGFNNRGQTGQSDRFGSNRNDRNNRSFSSTNRRQTSRGKGSR